MIQKTIKIYTWTDFKYWFWNRFCFPRRKLVTEWLTYHDDRNKEAIIDYLLGLNEFRVINECDMERLTKIDLDLGKIFQETRKESEEIILRYR